MQLFFTPDVPAEALTYTLNEEESKHAIRVLRLDVDEHINLIDGRGNLFLAQIIDAHPKRTELRILSVEREFHKPSYRLHIAVAPTKNIDRLEWFLEKATEVGIQEITPIISEHSERKEVKLERLNKVIVSAMKQSYKAYFPQLNPPISFAHFLKKMEQDSVTKAIAHCENTDKKYLNQIYIPQGNYLLLIGPEGDFSKEEITQALEAGYAPVSLGEARLRTETAALTACVEVALLNR